MCYPVYIFLEYTDDIISDKGPLEGSSNAIRMGFCHCVIQWVLFIATFVTAIAAICIFSDRITQT